MIHPSTEDRIIIDADSRKISVPKQFAAAGVCGDTNAETVYIYCPRFFDDIDWYNKKCLIRYVNAGNEYGEYIVTNMAIDASDTDMLIIGWTIQSPVTSYTGTIQFTLQFETVTDGNLFYQWQTQPAQMKILNGINSSVGTGSSSTTETYAALSNRIAALETIINTLNLSASMAIVNNFTNQVTALDTRLTYLENNAVYLSTPGGTSPTSISYSIVVMDANGNAVDSTVLYYGSTYQIILTDKSGYVVTGLTYSSDSPYVTVDTNGNVSVNYVAGMPTVVAATITTDYNPYAGYTMVIKDSDGNVVDGDALEPGHSYQISVTDASGNVVTPSLLTYHSDDPAVTIDSDGLVSVSFTSGMSLITDANITIIDSV